QDQTEDSRVGAKTQDRKPKTEDPRPKTQDRRPKTEGPRPKAPAPNPRPDPRPNRAELLLRTVRRNANAGVPDTDGGSDSPPRVRETNARDVMSAQGPERRPEPKIRRKDPNRRPEPKTRTEDPKHVL